MMKETSYGRISYYRTGSLKVQVATSPIFCRPGWELPQRERPKLLRKPAETPEEIANSLRCGNARARTCVRDLALNNRFKYFFTWTIDPKEHDSCDVDGITDYLRSYLRNITYRYGFSYILVAERHKSGAIHFHGLCNLGTMDITRAISSRTGLPMNTRKGQPIYNMPGWTWGFSTCIPIDGKYERVVNYLVKYITKDSEKILPRRYYSSRDLIRKPDYVYFSPSEQFDEWCEENNASVFSPFEGLKIATIYRDSDDPDWSHTYNLKSILDERSDMKMLVTVCPMSSFNEGMPLARDRYFRFEEDIDPEELFSGRYLITDLFEPLRGDQMCVFKVDC